MIDPQYWDMEHAAGFLLVLGAVAALPGLIMFWQRQGHRGGAPRSRVHLLWERSFIMSGAILGALAFVLLERTFGNSAGRVLAGVGATAYLFAAVLIVAAEGLMLNTEYEKVYSLVVVYVVVAFLAQAAIGGALLQAELVPPWIGWATIVWNVGCLVALALLSRRDMYFPVLHSLMPVLIGVGLLLDVW